MSTARTPQPALLTSARLTSAGFSHAFFTRQGGHSAPPWDTLNFSSAVGDEPGVVRDNLALAERALGLRPGRLYFLSQVHGCDARVLGGDEDWNDVVRSVGDVTLTQRDGVGCGV